MPRVLNYPNGRGAGRKAVSGRGQTRQRVPNAIATAWLCVADTPAQLCRVWEVRLLHFPTTPAPTTVVCVCVCSACGYIAYWRDLGGQRMCESVDDLSFCEILELCLTEDWQQRRWQVRRMACRNGALREFENWPIHARTMCEVRAVGLVCRNHDQLAVLLPSDARTTVACVASWRLEREIDRVQYARCVAASHFPLPSQAVSRPNLSIKEQVPNNTDVMLRVRVIQNSLNCRLLVWTLETPLTVTLNNRGQRLSSKLSFVCGLAWVHKWTGWLKKTGWARLLRYAFSEYWLFWYYSVNELFLGYI